MKPKPVPPGETPNPYEEEFPYQEVTNGDKLKEFVVEELERYNIESGAVPVDLVFFDDAIGHILRCGRVLRSSSGNAMLVGMGGMSTFSIEITKNYR